ncbi:MAG: 3-keto-5-aminohexanoate cleavage protein, partial [Longispora sp.]|nr:3-keto-5-aminohexanoate cleavage protein [Longispora sp. (in: high G+C Gram-positive bacteria)]
MVALKVERIKVCLNGSRFTEEHPAVPITSMELAAAAASAVMVGAGAVHMHPRNERGRESLDGSDIAAAVLAVRQACPTTPIGISTGLWTTDGDVRARLVAVEAWSSLPPRARPDFASVNLSEPGFDATAKALQSLGIAVEVGVWSTADAEALAAWGLAARCVRLLVEVIDVPAAAAVGVAKGILERLDALDLPESRLLHGEGTATWP